MTRDQILAQLGAIRAICDALASSLVAEPAAAADTGCPHPDDQRVDASTLGGGPRQFYCKACKDIVTE